MNLEKKTSEGSTTKLSVAQLRKLFTKRQCVCGALSYIALFFLTPSLLAVNSYGLGFLVMTLTTALFSFFSETLLLSDDDSDSSKTTRLVISVLLLPLKFALLLIPLFLVKYYGSEIVPWFAAGVIAALLPLGFFSK